MLLLLFELEDLPFRLMKLPHVGTWLLIPLFLQPHFILFETGPNLVHYLDVGAL